MPAFSNISVYMMYLCRKRNHSKCCCLDSFIYSSVFAPTWCSPRRTCSCRLRTGFAPSWWCRRSPCCRLQKCRLASEPAVSTCLLISTFCTKMGCYMDNIFGKMLMGSSRVVLQLPCYPGKQGELSEFFLQNTLPK